MTRLLPSRSTAVIAALALFAGWTQYQRWDAASSADSKLRLAISQAVADERVRQEQLLASVLAESDDQRLEDDIELQILRGVAHDLIADKTQGCVIPAGVIERLQSIN